MTRGRTDVGMKASAFDYACPTTLDEALVLLADAGHDSKIIAGGQSLMPVLAFRLAAPERLIDLRKVPGLDRIDIGPDGVTFGARVRWCDIEADARLDVAQPLIKAAMAHVAHYQIRQRGTVGGSLAHADNAAEMPGLAVACDAVITVQNQTGRRTVAAADFFVGPLTTVLDVQDLLTAVHFPAWPAKRCWGFEEFSRRRGDFALSGVATFYDLADDGTIANAHVGVFGACDHPLRITAAEAILDGNRPDMALFERAGDAAKAAVDPADDLHASAAYRRSLTGTLVERALAQAAARSS